MQLGTTQMIAVMLWVALPYPTNSSLMAPHNVPVLSELVQLRTMDSWGSKQYDN